jgi:tetratricopeptide (TPR) repeat protein
MFESAYDYLELAKKQLEQQNWQEAGFNLQKVIELQSDLWEAHYHLGGVFFKQQQHEKAIQAYHKAIALNPYVAWSYNNLGEALLKLEQFEQAVNSFCQAIKINNKIPWFYSNLGQVFLKQGRSQETINCFLTAVKLKPDSPELQLQLGQALKTQGLIKEAVNCFCQAIKIDPNYMPAYTTLRYTKIEPDWLNYLISFYQSILKINPNLYHALANLGDALSQKNRLEEAITIYRQASYYKTVEIQPELARFNWKNPKETGPDFIIIGAGKCGTTSLYSYLGKHPQILLANSKELDFFSKHFERGIDWYLSQFPTITDRQDFLTGEASPSYFFMQDVERKLFEVFPKVKLIVLLRNPVERTISDYYQNKKMGCSKQTLEEIVLAQIDRFEKIAETDLTYAAGPVLQSLYVYKLKRWMELFPKNNFLILQSEVFFNNPQTTMKQVFDFLGLSEFQDSKYHKCNVGYYPPIEIELRQKLIDFFYPHNRKLEEYLEREFNWNY